MIPGQTSTGSKRSAALFGSGDTEGLPLRMVRAEGCRVWDDQNRIYIDTIMALGAVSLGYAHPAVTEAVERAARDGCVGPLPPVMEGDLAERLRKLVPSAEAVRFLKTGAEAMSAAIRIARVHTGRERFLACGYHGWLDGLKDAAGVPPAASALRTEIPFNDLTGLLGTVEKNRDVAAIVIEPVIDGPPRDDWVGAVNHVAQDIGAVLILDEVKTGLRLGPGGAAARYGFTPDITVLGKALGNGLPIAAVCGTVPVMEAATKTWISSTLATEYVSLAAAHAVLDTYEKDDVGQHLATSGSALFRGLQQAAVTAPQAIRGVGGIPEFCHLQWIDDQQSTRFARRCADHGLLFKRNAYNFVSFAHTPEIIGEIVKCVEAVVEEVTDG